MASIAGFVIGSALASDLSESERMRLGLVGSLMPSPLVGALIVESLVESEEKGSGDKGEVGTALAAARLEDDKARVRHEKREVEAIEQELYDRAARAEGRGGFTAQEWDSANEDFELLKIQEEKLAEDRTKLVENALRAAEPSDSDDDQSE
jgi:hypothetical protein